ncbi:hypothetical protein HZC27_02930 [Candidatus Roizmanbacteria bacterium]|nr:hypothetical protein [Candidatus Roizmanbacteria bacterium]
MIYQKVFKKAYIEHLVKRLENNDSSILNFYSEDSFTILDENCLIDARISVPETINLSIPNEKDKYDFENAKIIYEAYADLPLIKASDPGLWTYLTHGPFWKYTKARWPNVNKSSYILEHWFVKNPSAPDLSRNAVSSLWWGVYLTLDKTRQNPYELTEMLFSMLDFNRTLISGVQGRNRNFTHAVLEYILEKPDLFSTQKEGKVRLLMRRMNFTGGYKLFTTLDKEQIKELLQTFQNDLLHYVEEDGKV